MSSHAVFTVLSSLLSLLGICYLFFWSYRAYCVDSFRQDLFELRDELFDYAASGSVDFNNQAYGVLRSTINGYIRFGHRLTLWHVICLVVFLSEEDRKNLRSFEKVWTDSIKQLDTPTKEKLNEFRERMERIAIRHVLVSAPECFLLVPLLVILLIVVWVFNLILSIFSKSQQTLEAWPNLRTHFKDIDNAALIYGEQTA